MGTGAGTSEYPERNRLALIEQTTARLRGVEVPESLLVSVVMPTRNRSVRVLTAIDSVRAQRYGRWELLVVDDGSGDDTRDTLARVSAQDDRVRPLRIEHSGPAVARNVALDHARGEVVAYLDDDNRFHPEWLRAVVWAFTDDAERCVLYGARQIDDVDRHRTGVAGGQPWVQFLPWDRTATDFNRVDMNVLAHRRSSERFDVSVDFYSDWDLLTRLSEHSDPYELPVIATYYTTDGGDRMTTSTERAHIERQYEQVRANIARRGLR
jgi:glycosyltransferase involved in cell wall biosynthesis